MTCKKCKSENLVMRPNAKNPTATELICADCGTWQKFISKEEIRVIEIHNKTKKTRITNADRIRSMSDEELARFLGDEPPYFSTYEKYLDWLEQPVKEEHREV